jgi:dolichol kinase
VFAIYVWIGAFSGPMTRFLLPVTWIALGATAVESLPFKDIDNITLTVVSALIGHIVF